MNKYCENEEYVSKKDYEKLVKENQFLKEEYNFIKKQIKDIYINCNNIINIIKK